MRLYSWHHLYSEVHKASKCVADMYIIGNSVYCADHLCGGAGKFFRTFGRYLHLVCGFIGVGQFNGMAGLMAIGIGWVG